MTLKLRTIFFGASSYVLPVIEMLKKNYNLALVVTTEQKSIDPVIEYCTKQHIPFISVVSLSDQDTRYKIQNAKSEFAVLADFRLMVRQDVIDIFPKGIINIHPSLLPQYRGPTPGTSAILDGKEKTGVSLMLLDTKLDHGPLLGQEIEHILSSDTSATLYPRLFEKGTRLLAKVLPQYLEGKVKPTEQDHDKATYTDFLSRDSGHIPNDKPLAISHTQLDRMVKAYYPWPGVWTKIRIKNQELRIKLLPNNMVQLEGKKPVSYKDFMNGYPEGKELLQKLGLINKE